MFMWGDLATHTSGNALTDRRVSHLRASRNSRGERASNVTYSLLPGKTVSAQAVINDYRQETIQEIAGSSSRHLRTGLYRSPIPDTGAIEPRSSRLRPSAVFCRYGRPRGRVELPRTPGRGERRTAIRWYRLDHVSYRESDDEDRPRVLLPLCWKYRHARMF